MAARPARPHDFPRRRFFKLQESWHDGWATRSHHERPQDFNDGGLQAGDLPVQPEHTLQFGQHAVPGGHAPVEQLLQVALLLQGVQAEGVVAAAGDEALRHAGAAGHGAATGDGRHALELHPAEGL